MVNDVLPETDLAVGAEFKFEAVEAGVVKYITETSSPRHVPSVEANNALSAAFNRVPRPKKLKQIQTGTNVKSRKRWRSQFKLSKKKYSDREVACVQILFCSWAI